MDFINPVRRKIYGVRALTVHTVCFTLMVTPMQYVDCSMPT